MRNLSIIVASLFVLTTAISCKKKEQPQTATKPISLETRSIQQSKGKDCDVADINLRKDCAQVDFTVPKLTGTGTIAKNVDAWADNYLLHLIHWAIASEDGNAPKTVEAGIKSFFATHDENAGSVGSGQYAMTCTHEELLNDGKYLTLMLNGYAFTGGNRELNDAAIASFDVKTGKQLTWADLVKDPKALIPIAQAKVKERRETAFKEGFTFDKEEPFALPMAYGLTTDGILMHYTDGEIYQLGGNTEFTVYFNELGNNLKLAAPAAPKETESDEDVYALYEVKGNEMVIFPFEIEVSNSAKAEKLLTGKKETLIVSANFWGVPKDPKEKEKGEDGMVSFVNKDIELTGDNRLARFEGLTFNKSLLSKVEDKDIFLLINVFSGRKSSNDNLLNCGILETKVSQVVNKRFVLGCKLISEPEKVGPNMANPVACYALPDAEEAPKGSVSFLVNCDSVGNMSFADSPMKDLDALKTALRPLLKDWVKADAKNLPGIETDGCLMGNSGAIRDMYEELTAELTGKAKPAEMENADGKISEKKVSKESPDAKPTTKTTFPKGLAGVYKTSSKNCPIELKIVSKGNGYTFSLKEGKKQHTGTLKSETQNQLIFNGLYGAEPKVEVEGMMEGGNIVIQNYGNSLNSFTVFKGCDEKYIQLVKTTETAPAKNDKSSAPATAKGGAPTVTLKQNGDMLLNGKAVGDFDQLRKQLQAALLAQATIPDKLELKTVGETGMGARGEVNTIISESIAGAKWVRKKAAIAALNTAVGKKLGTSTQLDLGTYQTNGNFAYISAKPKQADGKAIDYSKTAYAKEAAAGKHADNAIGLLQYDKGAWKVLTFSLGVTKAPVDAWVKDYKAPKALFGK
ncbi:MAG: hypothetical protein IT258_16665 [Saprospiraceae bacterium]|nr:hypothetical protein [Saprospiraceae bacterium]